MRIQIIDGQGGGIGVGLIQRLRRRLPDCYIVATGTNVAATTAMLKAGASAGATGDNAIVVNALQSDIIAGPVGIVIADSLMGELSARVAVSVGRSKAKRVLIPVGRCNTHIAGARQLSPSDCLDDAVEAIAEIVEEAAH